MNANELEERLRQMDEKLDALVMQAHPQENYTTANVATILGKRTYTVREWCRLGRVHAVKTMAGRGIDAEWRISSVEVERIKNEGLLPRNDRF